MTKGKSRLKSKVCYFAAYRVPVIGHNLYRDILQRCVTRIIIAVKTG
jgi:hypothetical protein